MKVSVNYGHDFLTIPIPDNNYMGTLNPKEIEEVKSPAGEVTKAHREGTEYIDKMFAVSIDKLADIVITSPGGYPKDIDLYQTHISRGKNLFRSRRLWRAYIWITY